MACNLCETEFQGNQSLAVSIVKSGSDANIHVSNQGRNIVQLLRIILCLSKGNAKAFFFLRPPPHAIAWKLNQNFLEPGISVLIFTRSNIEPGTTVQAQADYTELVGRSRSCPITV